MTKQLISNRPLSSLKPVSASELTKDQAEAVGYFFVRIKAIDPQQYDVLMPDPTTEKVVKREFAPYIINYTKQQIDIGLAAFHRERISKNPEYRFLRIDDVIGLVESGGKTESDEGVQAGAHKDFYDRDANGIAKRLPEPEYQRQKRKEKGLQYTSKILNMFD